MDIQKEIANILVDKFQNRFDEIITKGLELKGYVFEDKSEIEDFIKNNCRSEDHVLKKEKVFYVKEKPFLLHRYDVEFNPIDAEGDGNKFILKVNGGSYSYI